MDSYSLADIKAVTEGNDCGMGFGGGSWVVWILLFALLGGNGFGWGGRNGNPVTEADLCNANSFSELKNSVGRLNDQQAAIARQTDNAICQLGYQNAQHTYDLSRQIAECCCQTQLGIQSVKFDMANYASAIQMNDTANTQKVLDKLCQMELANKDAVIAQQGQRIAALEADARMCGIPRTSPYGYGIYAYPTCQTGYGCNGAY